MKEQMDLFAVNDLTVKKVKKKSIDNVPDVRANANTVKLWFIAERQRLFDSGKVKVNSPTYVGGSWTAKESTLAKKLLSEYGSDLTRIAIIHLHDNWSTYGFQGLPNINLLWSMRQQIYSKIQLIDQKKKHESTEYDETKAGQCNDFGW